MASQEKDSSLAPRWSDWNFRIEARRQPLSYSGLVASDVTAVAGKLVCLEIGCRIGGRRIGAEKEHARHLFRRYLDARLQVQTKY
jgi:hypothetical protein